MKTIIPDKLYFKIGEVAKLAEVQPHVLRYWESEFPDIQPKRARSKQRLYRKQDVVFILRIKSLLHGQGYTIAGARKFLESGQEIPKPVEKIVAPKTQLSNKLTTIKDELKKLQDLLATKKN